MLPIGELSSTALNILAEGLNTGPGLLLDTNTMQVFFAFKVGAVVSNAKI